MRRKLSLQERAKLKYVNEQARERLLKILQAIKLELKYHSLVNTRSNPNAVVNSEDRSAFME